jgi:hypothetical protein
MSDAVALDLFIQDFVTTNKVLNQHYDWSALVNRRFLEDCLIKVFHFQSNGTTHYAIGQHIALPDSDWFRIELTRAIPVVEEHRFDCLRMMQATTHTGLVVEKSADVILVKLTTRHRGLVNIVFVVRDGLPLTDPFLA